jgi:putative membrane-bound dehydrogenase-like protein
MFPALCLLLMASPAQDPGARLNVLFIGDRGHHQPEARLHDVYGPLVRKGFAIDWEDQLEFISRERLADYDCVVMYANQPQHTVVPPKFFQALRGFVQDGGGFVALHCTSGCFMQSQEWLEFVGARFVSHGTGVFKQEVIEPEHPVYKGWENFTSWDETYVQTHFPADRVVLSKRGDEDWSWVRKVGKGRIYYSASGHDARAWAQPAFLDMLVRAMDWTAGAAAAQARRAWREPQFQLAEHDWVPNYEGRDPQSRLQLPSTPEQARAALIVPAGFRAEVFAAEPMVINPIALAWDERGRCWVAESPDYPNTLDENHVGKDRISILEDTDGDGRADKKTVYCDKLNLPTSILKVKGGILVTQAPDLLFLRDDDGDDHCDRIETLFTGFGRWDTHAGPSNLKWGPDNAIWGSVGYASFTRADESRFGSGLWRWQQTQSEPEFMAQFTNNTWGLAFRADGEVFGSTANGAPSFYMGARKTTLAATAPDAPGAAPIFNTALFHPALAELHQGDFFGQYTAAAGHNFATGAQMPEGWADRTAFICGPTGHLVGRMDSYPEGSGWRSRDAFNLCTSLDDWFCPVQAEVGPDGAIWIADFAQFIILHNLPGNPERGLPKIDYGDGNAHINPLRDTEHGRIFRLVRQDESSGSTHPSKDFPNLQAATTAQLVAALTHPNQFWRTTARRLLVENDHQDAVPALLKLGNVEALRTLASLKALNSTLGLASLATALHSPDPALQKVAMNFLPATPASADLLSASGMLESDSADLRRVAMLTAARMPESASLGVALAGRALLESNDDPWLPQALAAAIAAHAKPFLAAAVPMLPPENQLEAPNLFTNPGFEQADPTDAKAPLGWQVRVYTGEAEYSWETGVGRNGSRALVIRSAAGSDTSWFTDVAVEPNTRYQVSGWIRTEKLTHPGGTHGALLNIHPRHQVTQYVQDDSDWTRVELEFQTGANETEVSINCLYGGWGKSIGLAIYDDLKIVSLGPSRDLRALVNLAREFAGEVAPTNASTDHAALLAEGNAAAGRETFFNNQIVACNRCHAWDGVGGGVGPDLLGVGQRLSREQLLESILDPNAALAESWPAPFSAMPALRAFLSDQELRDLITFLAAKPE